MPLNGVLCCHASVELALETRVKYGWWSSEFFGWGGGEKLHAYKDIWAAVYGEELRCEREAGNQVDAFAVAVMKDGTVVGHILKEISSVCSLYLHRGGSIIFRVMGSRRYSEDLIQDSKSHVCWFSKEALRLRQRPRSSSCLAAFIIAGFTEDERCPMGEGRRLSDGLK